MPCLRCSIREKKTSTFLRVFGELHRDLSYLMMGKGAWVAEPWGFLSNDWTQHVNPLRDSSQAPGIIIVVGHSSVEDHTSDQLERSGARGGKSFI